MKFCIPLCLILLFSATVFSQETIRIPDTAFEEALIDLEIDTNGLNGTILVSDAKYVVNLNIEDPENNKLLPNVHSKIQDLTGIEKFTNLKRLVCYGNDIRKLDVSNNKELTFLNCSQNKIKKLDVSKNQELFFLSCDSNKLEVLKLGQQPKLTELYASSNKLTEINLEGCKTLESVDVNTNNLIEILVSDDVASNIPSSWYKDANTVYTNASKATAVVEQKEVVAEITEDKKPEELQASTPEFDESFKKLLVKEFEQKVLNEVYLQQKKEELQKKYNVGISELSSWIQEYSKLKTLKNEETSYVKN